MSSPKSWELVYFDGPGRGEPIRILLGIAKIDFVDTRIQGKDWMTFKPTTPLGFLPVLKVGGVEFSQSVALTRYAATLAGWYPKDDPFLAMKVDEVCETLNELMALAPRSKDAEEFKKMRQEFQKGKMTQYTSFLEQRIKDNGGLYFAGKTPTVADLYLELTVLSLEAGNWDHVDKNFFDAFPNCMATAKAISENEQVKAYRDSVATKEP